VAKKIIVESIAELHIEVKSVSEDLVRVEMKTVNADFWEVVNAAQYLMWVAARNSDLEFEEALVKLCEGARSYTDAVHLVPDQDRGPDPQNEGGENERNGENP